MAGTSVERWDADGIRPVEGRYLVDALREALPLLEQALAYEAFGMTIGEVADKVLVDSNYELWMHGDSVIVTESDGPRLNFWLAAGNQADLKEMVPWIEDWARDHGMNKIMLYGRRGWERSFMRDEGYDPRWVIMVKELWEAQSKV